MKVVKWIIILVAAILALFLVITFFLPKDYYVERSESIEAPVEVVFSQVANLEAWQEWNPWNDMDPDMTITYGEQTSGVGAWYAWESDIAGNGKMTIIDLTPMEQVRYELIFEGYEDLPSYSSMILQAVDGSDAVRVTWTFEGTVGDEFFARWMAVMIDKFIGSSYEEGLESLKSRAEALSAGLPEAVVPEVVSPALPGN